MLGWAHTQTIDRVWLTVHGLAASRFPVLGRRQKLASVWAGFEQPVAAW